MLGFTRQNQPKLDEITVQVANATQRNEKAGLEARQVLEDMLTRNDGLKGLYK